MSEYEQPERMTREPTVEDIRQLTGASTPHFALQLRNRIQTLITGLPPDHPARVEGEREIARLDEIALGAERRGPAVGGEPGLPSLRG
jgi:hypothetical protein